MKPNILRRNFLVIFGCDVLLLGFAWYAAHVARFDFIIPQYYLASLKRLLPIILLVKIGCFYFFDLYRGMWRYTSIADLLNILKASVISSLLLISVVLFGTRFEGFSRSVFVIDWCLTVLFIAGFRLAVRLYFELFSDEKPSEVIVRAFVGSFKRKHPLSKGSIRIRKTCSSSARAIAAKKSIEKSGITAGSATTWWVFLMIIQPS
jgi:FlaA1/EpsC-like NDP-sugar epimerase